MKHVSSKSLMGIGLFACLLMLLVFAAQGEEGKTFEGLVVCIDAGHQGEGNSTQEPIGPGAKETKPCVSSGTRGKISGPEHAVNLDVALRLHELLIQKSITVVMTRVTPDIDLCNSERAAIANRCKADLFIRLHCNSGNTHGCFTLHPALIEGWTDDIYEQSLKAAKIVQKAYAAHTGIPDTGVRPRSDISGFNWSDVPVILPEMLYMQNPDDDQKASTGEFRQQMAEGLAKGILEYLQTRQASEKKPSEPSPTSSLPAPKEPQKKSE